MELINMQKYVEFGSLTVVILLSAIMLTKIDGSQNTVQAQNIASTLLPSALPPKDGTSAPTTPSQESSSGEDAISDSISNDASESGDVSDSQEDVSLSEGSNSVPIIPSPKSSGNNDESLSNSDNDDGNDESSGSSESGDGDDNNDKGNGGNNDISSQDTSSNEDSDSDTEGDVSSSDKEADDEDAFADGEKKYGKSQVVTQVNACGNDNVPINIGCQNTASQIQGDDDRIATAAAQSYDD
jgi:hypothetical protein